MTKPGAGHVFVVNGDLKKIACDAWLLPTDATFHVTHTWASVIDLPPTGGHMTGLHWDGKRVLRWTDNGDSPAIWLGDIGAVNADPDWYCAGLTAFVGEAARAIRSAPGRSARPRLAVNLIGSGHGGLFERRGALVKELLACSYRAAVEHDVDLILVTWGTRPYAAVQRARHFLVDHPVPDVPINWDFGDAKSRLQQEAERLASTARNGQLVLFVGAGASAGAGVPTWQELLTTLSAGYVTPDELEQLKSLDLRDQAAILKRRYQRIPIDFTRALNETLRTSRYALVHALLASLPVNEAVTTNFDTLLEEAMRTADRPLAVLPNDPIGGGGRWLLKLHGSLGQDDGVVLSRAEYLEMTARHGALFGLVQALLLTRHMLFVGYSLKDEDFHQLVHEVEIARRTAGEPFGTTLSLFNEPLASELWEGRVQVVPMLDTPAPLDEFARNDQTSLAAARLEIFLDYVAYLAADGRDFILDDNYTEMLTDEEQRLQDALEPLQSFAASTPDDDLKNRIDGILAAFGASPA